MSDVIRLRGARTHNLKNIDLDIARNRFVVVTGPSGSGKSSLAFDTLYAEGQRRYVESLSAYARQFLSMMEKPDVDLIEGLSPAIAIEQKSASHNPRSTVGTVTEIYDYLRLLFARAGTPKCPRHRYSLAAQAVSQMVDAAMALPDSRPWALLAPLVRARKGEHAQVLAQLRGDGYARARVDGEIVDLDDCPALRKNKVHTIEAVVDRFRVRAGMESRLAESFETALALGGGFAIICPLDGGEERVFSSKYSCPECGYSLDEMEPKLFSFNNPAGACPACDGLGMRQSFDVDRLVVPELSLSSGAVRGWDRRNKHYFNQIVSAAEHYGIDLGAPFGQLSDAHRRIVLYGSGEERVRMRWGRRRIAMRFEGVIPNLERRRRHSESDAVREELSKLLSARPCDECGGARLNESARSVFLDERSLPSLTEVSVVELLDYLDAYRRRQPPESVAGRIVREAHARVRFLVDVGLDYLSLDRSAETLSGGEAQRIRLARQIGSGLVGVMYILDEPTIGLHQRDNRRLLESLTRLRDLGNCVLVVEHDEGAIRMADCVIDIGPGAGVRGGQVVACGAPDEVAANDRSLTGRYLSGKERIETPARRRTPDADAELRLFGAAGNNLRNIDVALPLGLFVCVTGVSGSGKSTLVNGTLYPLLAAKLNRASAVRPLAFRAVEGLESLEKCIEISQSPIGRTPRSNPATYTGLFTPIRELFSNTPEARARGYRPGRFSFNVRGGRCEACGGGGLVKVEMYFLPDIYVSCDTCQGLRYNRETLEIAYKGKNISEVLGMTVEETREFYDAVPSIARKLDTLIAVGLSYISLGQAATTLSGGEAQRVKLSRELSRQSAGHTLYILDEPTTGLHFHDIKQLLAVLHRLCDQGNTVVVIEHNPDVIKTADWIIDLGPEGGGGGGRVVACGPPERIAAVDASHTGRFLRGMLAKPGRRAAKRPSGASAGAGRRKALG